MVCFFFLCFLLLADFRFWLLSIKQSQIAFFSPLTNTVAFGEMCAKNGHRHERASSEEGINEMAFCAPVVLFTCFPFFPTTLLGQKRGRIVDQRICLHVSGTVCEGGREMEESLRIIQCCLVGR